ncbi:MAG TPA: 2-hydroxychromene-2-carboxylate isomerase [Solirubrobacteraceae bacterium]|jgi:2-hydroxychromene-2-carboxylate isomerase
MPRATFYFDVGSPYAYLTAERIGTLPEPVDWQPVSLGALFKRTGRSSWAVGDPRRREAGMAEVERRARGYGLPPIHWPEAWPSHYLAAMRAATFAFGAGRGREFTLQAFRDAFQRGRDLSALASVLDAAESAGLDRREVELAIEDPQVKLALRQATDAAGDLGVFGVPTIAVDGEAFWGDDRLEEACSHLERLRSAEPSGPAGSTG